MEENITDMAEKIEVDKTVLFDLAAALKENTVALVEIGVAVQKLNNKINQLFSQKGVLHG